MTNELLDRNPVERERTDRSYASLTAERSMWGLDRSSHWLPAALALHCIEHDVAPGEYCWHFKRSGVRGLCMNRYERGIGSSHSAVSR